MKNNILSRYYRQVILLACCGLSFGTTTAQQTNLALKLDGNDNNPCIGMDIIQPQWTLEAWVKGNDTTWKEKEAIIGGGEYSTYKMADNLPLILLHGHLHSARAKVTAPLPLDDKWHHVAATCDGKTTRLFIDAVEVASGKAAYPILPGSIGTNDADSATFGGCIDEVRIWNSAIPASTLQQWMHKPISPQHPYFSKLKGYYPFDDMQDDVSLNIVGKGYQTYHLRNTRKKYKGNEPLAMLVPNDNPLFQAAAAQATMFNAVSIQSEWDADQGTTNDQILKLRIAIQGSASPKKLTALDLDLSGITNLNDVEKVHVYAAGNAPRSTFRQELFGTGNIPSRKLKLTDPNGFTLREGINYFLVTFDIRKDAHAGNKLQAVVSSFKLDNVSYQPQSADDKNICKIITPANNPEKGIVKVMQWNIWHGGIHLGALGQERIKELIRASHADIITMEEAYGYQQRLNDSLGFHLQTSKPGANLALYSRFPMTSQPTNDAFKSNTATITLPNGRPLVISNWWLRYAYKNEYTDYYPEPGYNVNDWIAEDKDLPLVDAQKNIAKDILPLLQKDSTIPVIVGGDFNSGSHLDWTARAAKLHYGYGPVDLPTSHFMLGAGYKDSFREIQPNEMTHQGGTFAAIYGHLQTSRIDFIYYKGKGIQAITSKIIRTAPEIDDVWASDHSAMITVFEVK